MRGNPKRSVRVQSPHASEEMVQSADMGKIMLHLLAAIALWNMPHIAGEAEGKKLHGLH